MIQTARRALLLGSTLGLAACGGGTEPTDPDVPPGGSGTVPVASVTVAQSADTIVVKRTRQLQPVLRDSAGAPLGTSGRTITYASSDDAVATVTSGGLVTAVALGTATITISSEGKSAAVVVTAAPLVAVGRRYPSLFADDTTALVATLADGVGGALPGTPAWTSANPAVATVNAEGVVTGVAPGRAWIVASLSGGRDSQEVVVLARGARMAREFTFTRTATGPSRVVEMWVMAVDGSARRRVSPLDQHVHEHAWAPDGSRLFMDYISQGGADVTYGRNASVTVAPDGSDERVLPGWLRNAVWAPDGSRIAYLENDDIWTVRPDGSDRRRLTTAGGLQYAPAWAPDSRSIAYVSEPGGGVHELWVMDADGANARKLATPGPVATPFWLPDGKAIVASTWYPHSGQQIVNSDGTGGRWLTGGFAWKGWSPDGRRVLMVQSAGDVTTWSVANVDGTDPVPLPLPAFCTQLHSLSWSPDASMLLGGCTRTDEAGTRGVVVMRPDGSGAVMLSDPDAEYPGSWRPE